MYVALKKKQLLMVSSLHTASHVTAVVGSPVNVKPCCVTVSDQGCLAGGHLMVEFFNPTII